MLLPIIHYVLGVAVLVLAIASILYCVRLAKAIDVRNNLRQVLLGTRFTTTTICGIVREVEVSAYASWPSVVITCDAYMLDRDSKEKGKRTFLLVSLEGLQASRIDQLPEIVLARCGANYHGDLSPEAKSIDLLEKLDAALESQIRKLLMVEQKIRDLSQSIAVCSKNPLLRPSLDNLQKAARKAEELRKKLVQSGEKIRSKIIVLRDFLALPQDIRTSLVTGFEEDPELDAESFEHEFLDIVLLMEALDELSDGLD